MKFNNLSQRSADNNLISLFSDIAALLVAFLLSVLIVFRGLQVIANDWLLVGAGIFYCVCVIFLFQVFEMYSSVAIGFKAAKVTICLTMVYTTLFCIIVNFIFLRRPEMYLLSVYEGVSSVILLLLWRYFQHLYFIHRKNKSKILMVEQMKEDNSRVRRLKYSCLDVYDAWYEQVDVNDMDAVKEFMYEQFPKYDGICLMESIPIHVKDLFIKEALRLGKEFFIIPAMYELNFTKVMLAFFDDVMVFHIIPHHLSSTQMFLKRAFDLLFSSVGLIVAAIPMAAIALAIKLFDPGPVFYKQIRLTKDMKEFEIIKFRTMVVNAEQMTGPTFARKNDPRITKLGRFLRASRLDELPQLINVFLGDMSFVGPRPERPYFVEQFMKDVEYYDQRFTVKAGLTSLSHVCGRYSTAIEDRTLYDLLYIINFSLLMDLKIILLTTRTVFLKEAAEGVDNGEKRMNQQPEQETVSESEENHYGF